MFSSHLNEAIAVCEQTLDTGVGYSDSCQCLGNVLQGMGNFEEAVIWHTRALQPQPDRAVLYAGFAKLYASQQQWQSAIAYYEQALNLEPNNADLYRHLASLHARIGNRDQEVMYRYQAVQLHPDWANPGNQLALGNSLLEQGKVVEAIACYQRGIQLCPDFYEAYYNLGVVLAEQDQWPEAIAAFSQALEINPDHAAARHGLGKLAERQGQIDAAIDHYQQAAELDPNDTNILYSLSSILLKQRQWQAAELVCRQAIALKPEFSWAHHNLGYGLLKQGQWEEAIEALSQSVQLNPQSAWTYYHLGSALSQQQQWQSAIQAFLSAIQLQKDLVGVYGRLGYVLRHCCRKEGLEAVLQTCRGALQPDRQTVDFYAELAQQFAQVQQFDGAIVFYDLALSIYPEQPELQQQRWQAIAGQQHVNQTIATYRLQIQQYPDAAWPYTHLGNLMADQEEREEAIMLHRTASLLQGWQSAAHRGYRFTHDWFTYNIPIWMSVLKPLAHYPQVRSLEVGSFEGMSACWLLDHILTHPTSSLTCVDHYFQEIFEFNVAQTGARDRLIQLAGDSHAVLATLEPAAYDFIYVDGCHLAPHVQQDAALSWRLLKAGGIMIFDDYEWTDPNYPGQDTRIGIDAFLAAVQGKVAIVHLGYQLIIQKLSSVYSPSVTHTDASADLTPIS
jgi:tetratricopeptide (TPR) repeat protein/predicted O-methyltransferase YrrM